MNFDNQMLRLSDSLRRLGILRTYRGYRTVWEAVRLVLEDEARLNLVTKGVYMGAASACGLRWGAVERNIRTVVRRAWATNPAYLMELAGYPMDGPPTASEFIDILATDAMRHAGTTEPKV